jgi:hypothetical protein
MKQRWKTGMMRFCVSIMRPLGLALAHRSPIIEA